MSAILKLDKMPTSCSECKFRLKGLPIKGFCSDRECRSPECTTIGYNYYCLFGKTYQQCPLQDTTELLEKIDKDIERTAYILDCDIEPSAYKRVVNIRYNLLELYKALGGKQ